MTRGTDKSSNHCSPPSMSNSPSSSSSSPVKAVIGTAYSRMTGYGDMSAYNNHHFSRGHTYLVRVLDEDVLAIRVLQAKVDDRADDSPPVRDRDIELGSEVGRANRGCAQDHMARVVARVSA
jgi:hypothetical protein